MASRKSNFGLSMPTRPDTTQESIEHDGALGGEVATRNRLPNHDERPWDPATDPFFSATSYPPTASHYFAHGAPDAAADADHVMHDTMAAPTRPPAHSPHPHPHPHPHAQPDYGEPFLTLTEPETAAMATILEPVRDKLVALKRTTEESLPQYHPSTRANPHAQVLGMRLDGIAKHVQQHLARLAESGRGMEELRLCRYMADEYWPLPVTATTHLDIFRIYRNRLARQVPPAQIEAEQAQHEFWVQDVASRRPETFGEAAARLAGRRLQSDLNDSRMVSMLEEEERQKQVENDGEVARLLAEQLNTGPSYATNTEALRNLHREVENQSTVHDEYHDFIWPLDNHRAQQLAQDAKLARMLKTKLDAENDNIPPLLPLEATNRDSRPRLDDRVLTRDFAQREELDGPQRVPHTRYRTAREESIQGNPRDTDPPAAIRRRAPAAYSRSTHDRRSSTIEEESDDDNDGA